MKKELKSFKRLLISDSPACSEREEEDDEGQSRVREGFLKITLHVLKKMKQTDLANTLQTSKSSHSRHYYITSPSEETHSVWIHSILVKENKLHV